MPFEKNEFMPAARILKKLEQVDPQAIYTLMTKSAIMTGRRHDESSTLSKLFMNACKKGWKNFEINMLTYAGPHNMMGLPENAFEMQDAARKQLQEDESARFWSARGDDLRLAISEYMTENNLTAQSLGLDQAEQDSLKLLLPKEAPRAPTPPTQAPIIWPMP